METIVRLRDLADGVTLQCASCMTVSASLRLLKSTLLTVTTEEGRPAVYAKREITDDNSRYGQPCSIPFEGALIKSRHVELFMLFH